MSAGKKLRHRVACARVCLLRIAAVFVLAVIGAPAANAEITLGVAADQTTYERGKTNTFDIRVTLFSQVFENADNIHFRFPDGVAVSAIRFVDGFPNCPDALLLSIGLGTTDAGWFNAGHPSGCGFFSGFPDGALQLFSIDADVPAGFSGDLRVDVIVEGDGCCDPPPHDATTTLTFADAASPARWNFEDAVVPALPSGWSTQTANAGVAWITLVDGTAGTVAHAPSATRRGEASLVAPPIAIGTGGGELRFRQRTAFDAGHDGGVLEIAIDGGAFADVIAAGGTFRTGGYDGAIGASAGCSGGNVNPLLGRAAFSGTSNDYGGVAVTLPDAAAGHRVQLRWRLGSDCSGSASNTEGWWIDDVEIVARAPSATIGPDRIALTLGANTQLSQTLGVGNDSGGVLEFAAATADGGDCSVQGTVSWLHLAGDGGSVAGGTRTDIGMTFDSSGLGAGKYEASLCVATNDPAHALVAVPVSLVVTPDACLADDRVFRDGFDGAAAASNEDLCSGSLRVYDNRAAFLADVAPGFAEDHYTGLRSGPLSGPIEFSDGTFAYSVFTQPDPLNPDLFLFPGAGVLSTRSAADQLTLTFTGAPVTALGGDFHGALFALEFRPPVAAARVVLTLDDGRSETFVARAGEDFRGFVSGRPIKTLSIATPDVDETFGDLDWGVLDNLVVGRAR